VCLASAKFGVMDTPQPSSPAQRPEKIEVGPGTGDVADVQPLDVTGVRTVAVGTLLFLAATIILVMFRGWLQDTGREWWLWTCVAGFGLGVFGYDYCRRRARHHHHPD